MISWVSAVSAKPFSEGIESTSRCGCTHQELVIHSSDNLQLHISSLTKTCHFHKKLGSVMDIAVLLFFLPLAFYEHLAATFPHASNSNNVRVERHLE